MKIVERITIEKIDLQPSQKLSDSGKMVFINPDNMNEELTIFGLTSAIMDSEQGALDSIRKKQQPLIEAMNGNKVYILHGETKLWNEQGKWVAYEFAAYPGLTLKQAQELLKA